MNRYLVVRNVFKHSVLKIVYSKQLDVKFLLEFSQKSKSQSNTILMVFLLFKKNDVDLKFIQNIIKIVLFYYFINSKYIFRS